MPTTNSVQLNDKGEVMAELEDGFSSSHSTARLSTTDRQQASPSINGPLFANEAGKGRVQFTGRTVAGEPEVLSVSVDGNTVGYSSVGEMLADTTSSGLSAELDRIADELKEVKVGSRAYGELVDFEVKIRRELAARP